MKLLRPSGFRVLAKEENALWRSEITTEYGVDILGWWTLCSWGELVGVYFSVFGTFQILGAF